MEKKPFATREKLEEIAKEYPTPFHLYDEKGIRENARALKEAFSWNPGFKEYFAVKATPNPFILKILQDMGAAPTALRDRADAVEGPVALRATTSCFPPMIRRQRNLKWRMSWGPSSIWTILPISPVWKRSWIRFRRP